MPREDKRLAIMQAAERLFTSRRFHEVTTDDVAREAKVGKGTIYRYFQDKDDLFFATAHAGFEELCELVRRKVPETAPFGRQLLEAGMQISEFFRHRRQLFSMMQSEEGRLAMLEGKLRQRWLEKRKLLIESLAAIMRKGIQEGEVRQDLSPEVLASFLLGMLRTSARDLRDAPEEMRRLEVVVDLFRRGADRKCSPK